MSSLLLASLGTTEELAAVFSDSSVLAALLAFESALARSQACLGLIPQSAAAAISRAAVADGFDAAAIAREARRSATLAIPFVNALVARVAEIDEPSARFVHWGATSQDIVDTAMVLLLG
ncbi:MAG: lyase family protein, partial [Bryobacteraceae bacterium]